MIRTVLALSLLLGVGAGGQTPADTSPELQATLDELQAVAARAQVIFTGQVAAIDRNDAAGFVDIRFRIDRSLRGAPAGGSYVLREWAGLWMAHPDRYRVGERRLMLLPARSSAGFSAPLGDNEGAIPLIPTGSADAASPFAVDLRWVECRAPRSTAVQSAHPRLAVQPTHGAPEWPGPVAPLAASSQAERTVPLTAILTLLGGTAPTMAPRGPLHAR